MQLPVIFLSIIVAVSAAPQLFFAMPPQYVETKSMQELNKLIPAVVPVANDQIVAASEPKETLSVGNEPAPEVVTEVPSVVAEEPAEESIPIAPVQEEPAQDQEAPRSEAEVTTDAPVVREEATEPVPADVAVVEPEIVTEVAIQEQEIILPEVQSADVPSEVFTNDITPEVTGVAETVKTEENQNTGLSSGKSIQSAVPSTSLITHFGYSNPNAVVRAQPNTITYQGTVVDPRTLVPNEFKHFIYQNDSPEVVAAKVAFFRIQAALSPTNRL